MPFSSFDAIVQSLTNGKKNIQLFQKNSPAVVGVAGSVQSTWLWPGNPVAGTYAGTALAAVTQDSTIAGALYTGALPAGGETKHLSLLAAKTAAATAVPGDLVLIDRLLYYPGISTTVATAQTLTNGVSLPRYTSGEGVLAFLETTTILGATAASVNISYTNQAGTAGKTLGATTAMTASSAISRVATSGQLLNNWSEALPLAAGDYGIRSVQSVTLSANMGAGACALVLYKPLARIPLAAINALNERDMISMIASLERIYDGACLSFLFSVPGALVANTPISGNVDTVWG